MCIQGLCLGKFAVSGCWIIIKTCVLWKCINDLRNSVHDNKKLCCRKEAARDASCFTVVSFNSTKRRAESFIVSYMGYRFITAYD